MPSQHEARIDGESGAPSSKRRRLALDSSDTHTRSSSRRSTRVVDYSLKRPTRKTENRTSTTRHHVKSQVDPINAKKHELNTILDRYDSNVRLLFHLEKFVSLVYYNPKDAKSDTSNVFEEYRQKYDLWAKLGASRHTRRQIQHVQNIYEEKPSEVKKERGITNGSSKPKETRRKPIKHEHHTSISPVSVKKKVISQPKPQVKPTTPTRVHEELPFMTWDDLFPVESKGIVMNIPEIDSDDESSEEYSEISEEQDEKIPRIKVLYDVAKGNVTHPSHVVSEPEFSSLESYLDSFLVLDSGDIDVNERDDYIREQIDIHQRIKDAKARGLISEDGYTSSEINEMQKFVDPISGLTHQDHLISQGIFVARAMRDERKSRISQARKVAQMIESYFKRLSGAEERERKAQEKAIRQLAKRTAQEVMKKWKLAEKVVNYRRQKVQEEVQREQGKLHLNQILEHSAQLLEARIEDTALLNQEFDSDSDDESGSDINDFEDIDEEKESGSGSNSDMDSDELTSESESENEVAAGEPDEEDDKLTIDELRNKYMNIGDDEEEKNDEVEEQVEQSESEKSSSDVESPEIQLDERAFAIYKEEIANGPDDSDESIPMDSEDESETSDESDDDSDSDDETTAKPGLASLFSNEPIQDDDSDDEDLSMKEDEAEVETPTSTPDDGSKEVGKTAHVRVPFLLRGTLREYQHDGLDWLVGLYNNQTNGILADEMGLGKTIQTIALLSYLACEKEVWGPHLIVVPTSVMLNWEMEFKRFAPGFKVLTYFGNPQQRKEKRRGWNKDNTFHVCITSYQLVLQDQHAFRRKKWHYLILDEAHNIKNFRSQRWQALLNFNSERRLLLTGTPLQNNLVELWSLLYFLMPSSRGTAVMPEGFANLQDFQEWFARPVDRMVEEGGDTADDETRETVAKLHQVLRPYLLRRLKKDVEKQMPGKYEHIVYCRLSKRQRYLYDDFMSRAQTRETLASGNFLSIINCLMQLRKVCNHPDLFEVRPIVTSLAIEKSIPGILQPSYDKFNGLLDLNPSNKVNLDTFNFMFSNYESMSALQYQSVSKMRSHRQMALELAESAPRGRYVAPDFVSVKGHSKYREYSDLYTDASKLQHSLYLNIFRCARRPLYGTDVRNLVNISGYKDRSITEGFDWSITNCMKELCKTYTKREQSVSDILDRYSFVTPKVLYLDMPETVLGQKISEDTRYDVDPAIKSCRWDQQLFHNSQERLSIAFPDKRLLQYDCGKLQRLAILLRDLTAGGHRALIFTQMTKVLDVLEQFLNIHGYRYMRLDGATKVEQRQALTERFNNDSKIPVFILSSRSGGLGINLTGADTVIFYDSDWNPSMDKQCQDRCHRIGQTRDVHIYRFVSEYTIESNILKKATQKQILDNVVIQDGEFTTDYFNKLSVRDMIGDIAKDTDMPSKLDAPIFNEEKNLESTLAQAEDVDDATAANIAQREEDAEMDDFTEKENIRSQSVGIENSTDKEGTVELEDEEEEEESDDNGNVDEYMIRFIEQGYFD